MSKSKRSVPQTFPGADPFAAQEPLFAQTVAASLRGRVALGPRARQVLRSLRSAARRRPSRGVPGLSDAGRAPASSAEPPPVPGRLSWATLLRRVFATQILVSPHCGGARRILQTLPDLQSPAF